MGRGFWRWWIAWMRSLRTGSTAARLPLEDAMTVVRSEAGHGFDPRVVEILRRATWSGKPKRTCRRPNRRSLSKDVRVERGLAPAAGFRSLKRSPAVAGSPNP